MLDDDNTPSLPATARVTIAPINDPPVAKNDTVAGIEGLKLNIDPLLDHTNGADLDVDDVLTRSAIEIRQLPLHGSLLPSPDGRLLYTPARNYNGADSFRYIVRDSQGVASNEAVVTIQLSAVNFPPMSRDDRLVISEDPNRSNPPEIVVLNNADGRDVDLDGNLVLASVSNVTYLRNGSIDLRSSVGSYLYLPYANFNGKDEFTYMVQDNRGALNRVYEGLTETIGSSQSRLNHEWNFTVGGDGQAAFVVSGFHTSRVESFTFEYSTDHVNWQPMNIELTNATQTLTFPFPSAMTGPVTVRVVDTDRTVGELATDSVYIDDMFIRFRPLIDNTLPTLSIGDVTVAEDGSATPVAQFVVTRSGDPTLPVTVGYETFDQSATAGADYTALTLRALVFDAGQTQRTISVPVNNDTLTEGAESFGIRLQYAVHANLLDAIGVATIAPSDGAPNLAPSASGDLGASFIGETTSNGALTPPEPNLVATTDVSLSRLKLKKPQATLVDPPPAAAIFSVAAPTSIAIEFVDTEFVNTAATGAAVDAIWAEDDDATSIVASLNLLVESTLDVCVMGRRPAWTA